MFGQIWIIPIKSCDFFPKVLNNFWYAALSGDTLLQSVMSQHYNCLVEMYTNLNKIKLFIKTSLDFYT